MKILVDIIHPANVHYFKNFISEMEREGNSVKITARNKDVSFKLLDAYNFKYLDFGHWGLFRISCLKIRVL